MKIFILHSIGENIFNDEIHLQNIIKIFSLDIQFVSLGCISGYFGDISDKDFLGFLPVLNGYIGKNFFYNALKIDISHIYILGKNILDFEYDEKIILENSQKIEAIKKELSSDNLITNSKKQEFASIILGATYNIGGFLIKTFFLMEEMISNKNDLQKIIHDEKGLIEFKAQAQLLDTIAFDKLDIIKVRFDSINFQLQYFSEILYKYFTNYIK